MRRDLHLPGEDVLDDDHDIAEIFRAVGTGRVDEVNKILEFRPELSRAFNEDGLSILAFARYMGHDDIIEALVEAGPALDIWEACFADRADDVRRHIERAASVISSRGDDGWTPLHLAADAGAVRAVEALLAAGAHIEAKTRPPLRATPLHLAALSGRADVVRVLLRAGADPNACAADDVTPLMYAAMTNNREIAEMLIARNANYDLRDSEGFTAADIAAEEEHIELAARLRLGERSVDHKNS